MYKTKQAKQEELEALKGTAESIQAQIIAHQKWLSYQTPWDKVDVMSTFPHTLAWYQSEQVRFAKEEVLVAHYKKLEAEMLYKIAAVKEEVERLQQRLGGGGTTGAIQKVESLVGQ
jgi:hypothetical protein